MRLTCPNCGAQYEVPEDAIPETGRDLECSNCGHGWYEMPGVGPMDLDGLDDGVDDTAPGGLVPDPDAPQPHSAPEPDPDALQPDPDQPRPALEVPRVSPDVASLLQQERDISTALRRSAAPEPLETQSDLPLFNTPPTRQRPAAEAPAPRRERLPDVDQISPTLGGAPQPEAPQPKRPAPSAAPGPETAPDPDSRYRRGFRLGFGLAVLAAALAVTAYVTAPDLARRVPAAAPALDAYVDRVDGTRLWLNDRLQAVLSGASAGDAPQTAAQ